MGFKSVCNFASYNYFVQVSAFYYDTKENGPLRSKTKNAALRSKTKNAAIKNKNPAWRTKVANLKLKKMANWIPFDNDMYADLVHTLTTLNDDEYALKPPGNDWTLQRKNSLREGKIFF